MTINLKSLQKPQLLLNKEICKANINRMILAMSDSDSIFRPHFKTHNSPLVGEWFREQGVRAITVSSFEMAFTFINAGWKDITIAFPFNLNWCKEINKISGDIKLNITIEDTYTATLAARDIKRPVGVMIKTDTGYGRTGIRATDYLTFENIIDIIDKSKTLQFIGFLAHAGHTYKAPDKASIKNIYYTSLEQLNALKAHIGRGLTSYGDTPSCSLIKPLSHFDEYRPGNFVFYDLMQLHLGACTESDIALILACPVASVHQKRNEIVVHGGAVHLSKEYLEIDGEKIYGKAVLLNKDGTIKADRPNGYVRSLSQEHGIINADNNFLKQIKPGDTIGILPVHACLTAQVMGYEYSELK